MTESDAVVDEMFDRRNPAHIADLRRLYAAYIAEQLMQGRIGVGAPAAPYLNTLLLRHDRRAVGFLATRIGTTSDGYYAVELTYIEPPYRRRGIVSSVIRYMKESCPGVLVASGPATPEGEQIARACGLDVVGDASAEMQEKERATLQLLVKKCNHRRGRPDRLCKPCCKRVASDVASAFAADMKRTGGVGMASGLF